MKKSLILFVLIVFIGCTSNSTHHKKTIESADALYNQLDLKQSGMILKAMLENDSLDAESKCIVLRKLAHQDWKYYKNYDLAKHRLYIADSIGNSKSKTWSMLSRIERESGNYEAALAASLAAKSNATSVLEKTTASVEYARTVYDLSLFNISNGLELDTALLSKTSADLLRIIKSDAGAPEPSKLLLAISLLQNNGANVIKAWKSYFHISDIHKTYDYLFAAAKELNGICKNWNGEILSREKQEKLIWALSASRFYEYAGDYALYNAKTNNYSQRITDLLTYSSYLKKIKAKTNEYYRQIAIGKENEKQYKRWLNDTRKELWQSLSFLSDKEYSESRFLDETERHFGARGFTGSTGNYSGYVLCLGHIVNQGKALIEQYGYKPEFTYTQIDLMISNGYSSWFWEDKAIGGWASSSEIIRVREAYLNGPNRAWASISDTIERQNIEATIHDFLNQSYTNDIHKLSDGLAKKLRFDALNDLYDKLYAEGLRGDKLKLAFLSNYEKYRTEASIFSHEGRHSIDKKYMPEQFREWSNEKIEFHAKLSQLVFASEPRLELSGMVGNIGTSGHGLANKMIVDVAINWIKNNSKQIKGYSTEKSPFSQLYLLTNEQLKKCFRSADPLYKSGKLKRSSSEAETHFGFAQ